MKTEKSEFSGKLGLSNMPSIRNRVQDPEGPRPTLTTENNSQGGNSSLDAKGVSWGEAE